MQRWALIMGASGDIGSQIARDLAAQGWSLYLHYHHNQTKINQLRDELSEQFSRQDFLVLQLDMCQPEAVPAFVQQLFGVDAVIFAEGTTKYGLFADSSAADLNQMITMQLTTPLTLVRLLQPKLAQSGQGRIVFIGSVYGGAGSAMEVGYSTIKGALSAFARAYSKEVVTLNITVNVVAPGAVATHMNQMFSKEARAEVAAAIPAQRFANPEEVSYWVQSLLAQKAGYLTGQTLYVTGGWLK